jgi:hypothetical protein
MAYRGIVEYLQNNAKKQMKTDGVYDTGKEAEEQARYEFDKYIDNDQDDIEIVKVTSYIEGEKSGKDGHWYFR